MRPLWVFIGRHLPMMWQGVRSSLLRRASRHSQREACTPLLPVAAASRLRRGGALIILTAQSKATRCFTQGRKKEGRKVIISVWERQPVWLSWRGGTLIFGGLLLFFRMASGFSRQASGIRWAVSGWRLTLTQSNRLSTVYHSGPTPRPSVWSEDTRFLWSDLINIVFILHRLREEEKKNGGKSLKEEKRSLLKNHFRTLVVIICC